MYNEEHKDEMDADKKNLGARLDIENQESTLPTKVEIGLGSNHVSNLENTNEENNDL